MEDKWSKDQSDQITALYGQLKGKYEKEAYQKLYAGPQREYLDAFNTLTSLLKEQEAQGGLEQAIKGAQKQSVKNTSGGLFNLTPRQSAVGLITALIVVALASAGIPYVPPPLY